MTPIEKMLDESGQGPQLRQGRIDQIQVPTVPTPKPLTPIEAAVSEMAVMGKYFRLSPDETRECFHVASGVYSINLDPQEAAEAFKEKARELRESLLLEVISESN